MVRKATACTHAGFSEVDLADFLGTLPGPVAEAARLHWVEGYTQEEVAARLGVARQTVTGRVGAARRRFAELGGV